MGGNLCNIFNKNVKRILRAAAAVIILVIVSCAAGCGAAQKNSDGAEKLKIVTTIFPQYDFARAIAGDSGLCDITMLITPGAESHSFQPSVSDMLKIEQCDILICAGGDIDSWVQREIMPSIDMSGKTVLYMKDMVEGILCAPESNHGHSGDDEDHDEHGAGTDDHVWTSLANAKTIVENICDAMCSADGKNEALYLKNAEAYINQLGELDREFKNMFDGATRKTIVVGDRFPFVYFAEEYGLAYKAAFSGCSSSSEPALSTINELVNVVNENHIPVVFCIEFSDGKTADAICKATGARRLVLHSCHNVSKEDFENGITYIELMRQNFDNITEAVYE